MPDFKSFVWTINFIWFLLLTAILLIAGFPDPIEFAFIIFMFWGTQLLTLVAFIEHRFRLGKFFTAKGFRTSMVGLIIFLIPLHVALFVKGDYESIYVIALNKIIHERKFVGEKPKKVYLNTKIYPSWDYDIDNVSIKDLPQLPPSTIVRLQELAEREDFELIVIDENTELEYERGGGIIGGGVTVHFSDRRNRFYFASIDANIYFAGTAAGGMDYTFYRWLKGWEYYYKVEVWIS